MNGRDFWNIFVAASIPDNELMALGEDIGYLQGTPSAQGKSALLKFAYAMKQYGAPASTDQIFTALKAEMPGIFSRKGLLTGMASDYDDRKSYDKIRSDVRGYVNAVGGRLPSVSKKTPEPGLELSLKTSSPLQVEPSPARAPVSKAPTPVVAQAPTPPAGLTQDEYDLLRGVGAKLQDPKTAAEVTAPQLAAARNLAARAKLTNTQALLDAEIEARGEGAQDPDARPVQQASTGLGGIIAILGIFLVMLFRR